MLDKVGKYLPLISILAFLLGYYDVHSYYHLFDIDISSFLEPTEVIFSLSWIYDSINILTFTILISVFGNYYVKIRQRQILALSNERVANGGNAGRSWPVAAFKLIYFVVAGMWLWRMKRIEITNGDLTIALYMVGLAGFFVWNSFRGGEVLNKIQKPINVDVGMVVVIGLVVFLFIRTRNDIKVRNIRDGFPKFEVVAITEGQTYRTTDSLLFIGLTQKYLILHNIKSKKNSFIPRDDIRELDMKTLRPSL